MINPPFTVTEDREIVDANGSRLLFVSSWLPGEAADAILEFFAKAANVYHASVENARKVGAKSGGRPREYEPRKRIEQPKAPAKAKRGRPAKYEPRKKIKPKR